MNKITVAVRTTILVLIAAVMIVISLLIMRYQGKKVLFDVFGVWMNEQAMDVVSAFSKTIMFIFSNVAFWLIGAAVVGIISKKKGAAKYLAGIVVGSIAAPFLFYLLYAFIYPHNKCGSGLFMCGECACRLQYVLLETFLCIPVVIIFGIIFLIVRVVECKKAASSTYNAKKDMSETSE